jgi:AmmeMemoRadiSam system protein B
VRPAVAAGTFYPPDATTLAEMVDRLLEEAGVAAPHWPPVSGLAGLIVPHAGYRFSGPVAASAYALLRASAEPPRRAAVLGPAHFVPLDGSCVPAAGAWSTPLGEVPIDGELRGAAAAPADDVPHASEHAVEVQLPFLQRVLGPAITVLPVAVGRADPEVTAGLIGSLIDVPGTVLIVSTDLSHYLPVAAAREIDTRTADAVVRRDAASIASDHACGVHALRGALALARRRGLRVKQLDLRNSADTVGDPSRVVGYGAFALEQQPG